MGPIEQQFASRAYEVRTRLMNTVPPSKPKESKTIEIVDEKHHLQAKIDSLLDQLKFANEKIKNLQYTTKVLSVHTIIAMVCETEGVTRADLISPRRDQSVMMPRQVACYLAATRTLKTLKVIGRSFGNRDHTTILHAKQKIAALRIKDSELDNRLKWYEERL